MAEIIDGKLLAQKIRNELKEKVIKENLHPYLAVILCGDDEASKVYVKNKSKACDEIGIEFKEYRLPKETKQEEIIALIKKLNNDKKVNGILLQSPLPKGLDIQEAFNTIDPDKDVDGFNPYNVGKLTIGQDGFVPCTPLGIMKMFEHYGIKLEGKKAVVVGRSNIVGKPMAQCLLGKNVTVTICHSKTQNLTEICKNADILVAAVGKANFVTADMVKEGAVVIDVGMNRLENGKLCGDVDFNEVQNKASYITPVPGGVGPMTIAMLMQNTFTAAKLQNDIK